MHRELDRTAPSLSSKTKMLGIGEWCVARNEKTETLGHPFSLYHHRKLEHCIDFCINVEPNKYGKTMLMPFKVGCRRKLHGRIYVWLLVADRFKYFSRIHEPIWIQRTFDAPHHLDRRRP